MNTEIIVALIVAIPATFTSAGALVMGILNQRGIKTVQVASKELAGRMDGQLDAQIRAVRDSATAAGREAGASEVRVEVARVAEVATEAKRVVDEAAALRQRDADAAKLIADALLAKNTADAVLMAQLAQAAQAVAAVPPPPVATQAAVDQVEAQVVAHAALPTAEHEGGP